MSGFDPPAFDAETDELETEHRVVVGDSRELAALPDDSVELVVTSPPYPLVEMWDEVFADLNPAVADALERGDGPAAFEAMHAVLDEVWSEVARVLVDGGIACINVGDATRTLGGSFRVYQNHSRVVDAFEARGFDPLPEVLWRKPSNSAAKFMGSGMLAPNAYVTLEHEYILVFRKSSQSREFDPGARRRYEAAYFWEERNRWFSDVWTDIQGELQALPGGDMRDRSAAFPFEIPYRLINMYSVYGDTVLDPFWGTGTTSLGALVAGRNSVGYERNGEFPQVFQDRVDDVPSLSRDVVEKRLADHREFVAARRDAGDSFEYDARHYDVPVTTKQERSIRLYAVEEIERTPHGYRARHVAVSGNQ